MINILLCGNEKVFDGALTELISITNRTKEPVNCYIFTMNLSRIKPEYISITDEQVDFLNGVVKSKNKENNVTKIDVTELYEREFMNCANETAYCTPYTLLRLLADLVPNMPDKLLYLDIDIMAGNDISKLYNIDISEYEYAAVKEKYGCWLIRPDYINAGMLLLNMKKIKETKLLEKARHLIKTKKMLFADQDAIFRSTTKKLIIPRIFNEQSKFNKKDTVICHFCKRLMFLPYPHTENYKQWNVNEVHKVLKCYYFDKDLDEYIQLKEKYNAKMKGKILMNQNKNDIPIFFAVDNGYIPFLAVSLQSLIDNSNENNNYNIKILYTDISDENIGKILKYERENVKIEFVNLTEYIKKVQDKLYTRDYYSKTTYFRLFLPDLYPEYDKVLYLDSDIVILDDIANLYNIDMGDNLVAGVPDDVIQTFEVFQTYVEKVVGVADYRNYFNAGILLMNLDELRKFNFQEKFLYSLDKIKFSVAQDQDYLNRLCKGRVKIIDKVWNKMPIAQDNVDVNTLKLIHYNLAYKPWHFEDILYKEIFWKYAEKTEFFDIIKNIKDTYTDKDRQKDLESDRKLKELAQKESDCVGDDRINRR